MRPRHAAFSMGVLLFALVTTQVKADWIINGGFGRPLGVAIEPDRVMVFAHHETIELAPDGTFRKATVYEIPTGGLQLERVVAAREGFVVCGVHVVPDSFSFEPFVMRLNHAGEVQWTRAIETNSLTDMTVAVETSDGDIVVATRKDDALLLVRFSSTGETRWGRTFDRTDVEGIRGIAVTRDGGVLIVTEALTRFAALTRVDANGKILWERVLGNADASFGLNDAVELPDGGFIAAGRLRNEATNDRNGWLIRVSAKGDVVWQKSLGGTGEDGLFAIARTGNELVAVGGTTSAGKGDADTWIVRFTADGTIGSEIAVGTDAQDGPLENDRSPISTTEKGELLFASSADVGLLIGRLGSSSETCALTHAIRTKEHPATASPVTASLTRNEWMPTTRSLSVLSLEDTPTFKPLCQWSAAVASATRPVDVASEPQDEEATFADDVARLLLDRKFAELDQSAALLRDARSTFDSGRSKLRAFYEALGRHNSLVALGAKHAELLEAWRNQTHSATSSIALASRFSSESDRIRGTGFPDTLIEADSARYRSFRSQALALLAEQDHAGTCDAPCYDLQIRTAQLGGLSEALQKLQRKDPTYWEALAPAILYLGENWGGQPGDIPSFVEHYVTANHEALGDAPYAFLYASWMFGVLHVGGPPPPPPDWTRMRKGFLDFQRLHPRSRWNAQRFAAAAYRVARDRDTARSLFTTPLLSWNGKADAWLSQREYESAKTWALGKPVEAFATALVAAKSGPAPAIVSRVVAPAIVSFRDGSTDRTHAIVVATANGLRAIASPVSAFTEWSALVSRVMTVERWLLDGDIVVSPQKITRKPEQPWAIFAPSADLTARLHPLKMRVARVETGDRLYVVACSGSGQDCHQHITAVRALHTTLNVSAFAPVTDAHVDWMKLAGAPVFDDDGALAGLVGPVGPLQEITITPVQLILDTP